MMSACPNIQELHVMGALTHQDTVLFFSEIQLNELTFLNVHSIELSGSAVVPLVLSIHYQLQFIF